MNPDGMSVELLEEMRKKINTSKAYGRPTIVASGKQLNHLFPHEKKTFDDSRVYMGTCYSDMKEVVE